MLRTTLSTLEAQSVLPEAEVVVVDMSSHDGTVEMLRAEFPRVRVLCDVPNRGYGAAVNAGLACAASEWVLACNSDLEFRDPSALGRLLAVAAKRPRAGVFGVTLVDAEGAPLHSARALPGGWALAAMFCAPLRYLPRLNARALGYMDEAAMSGPTSVGWVCGALLLLRRSALEAVGSFDEDFFMNSEEVDLCARMHEAGMEVVFVPEVSVVHLGGGSTPTAARSRIWLAEGMARYSKKHSQRMSHVAALAAAVIAYVVSLPVWFGRVLLRRQSIREAGGEASAFARSLWAATHV
jgi:GT2 family glycosyltransferase